jgi:N-acetylmuramoyl-L-alanine amidase
MRIASRCRSTLAICLAVWMTTSCTDGLEGEDTHRRIEENPSSPPGDGARQQAFADAAAEFAVPEGVLLAVSYLESRWDAHAGEPSRAAGYGPMHLTDAASASPASTAGPPHHSDGSEDARGDDARPALRPAASAAGARFDTAAVQTLALAAELSGASPDSLRTDPRQNIRGGAALLAHYQRELTGDTSSDPADWYGAVARYAQANDIGSARRFADEAYAILAQGAARIADGGQYLALAPRPEIQPRTEQLARLGLRETGHGETECPHNLGCEWIPAPYEDLGEGDYGNHDLADRPHSQKIRYIIIHDTETDYDTTLQLVQDPTYVSWQYTLRSSDGHIAQHVKARDVAWHAGNWYINAKAIGLEHEGFAAQGTWYTEAMYRSSARLVRYLASRHHIPLDRAHILGHDNVPGTVPSTVAGMHWDPGPYWDWDHYFDLLRAPLRPTGGPHSGLVTIAPDFDANRPPFFGCDASQPAEPCPPRGSTSVILHAEPSHDAPLLQDIGLHPDGSPSTMRVSDIGSRVDTGQQYAVAERSGEWTAIWYLGQKGWFHDPPGARSALWATGWVATPKPGRDSIPVFGRAYPEPEAYPEGVPPQAITPLQYALPAGQRYAVGMVAATEYYRAVTIDPANHVVVEGDLRYYQIQFGHRIAFVLADDVDVVPSWVGAP